MKKTKKRGFTIIELVIVIAVIAILAAVMIPTFSNVVEKANQSAALENARNAYTTYLAADETDITEVTSKTICIKSGDYYVHVTNGSCAIVEDDTSCSATAHYKISDAGSLETESHTHTTNN